MTAASILRVAVPAPLSRLFDYRLPQGAAARPGCRVAVPFGRRHTVGLVMEVTDRSELPDAKLRPVQRVLDAEPILTEDDLWLLRFTSDYYHHPIGEVAAAALPALLRQGRNLVETAEFLEPTDAAAELDLEVMRKRAPRQAEVLEAVLDGGRTSATSLDETTPGWRKFSKALVDKGLLRRFEATADDDELLARVEQETGPELNPDQKAALADIRSRTGFSVNVIDGVTGSGKTEVYLSLIRQTLAAGRQALVLVPEIGLTPQLVRRFRRRIGIEPVLLHSGLTDASRLAGWRRARNGSAPLIVGTRSAVFVPLGKPGLIVVDEEHDASLKQQEGLRYSARDLAVARGKRLCVPVVLGSATPALETVRQCRDGAYHLQQLPSRAGGAVPPLLRLVDLSRHPAADGLSDPVVRAITATIAEEGQALVYLNRRGYAPTLICSGCGRVAECSRCDSRMTVHAAIARLRCHHCGAERPVETSCADCGAVLVNLGHGTERLEDALSTRFPGETVTRIDSDSTRLKGTMTRALKMATAGETRILVGTQMLSKGHHFPRLTLVAVINADQGLFSTDFRGAERLAQTLVQVSGRAGREERQGEVIIQTAFPRHRFWSDLLSGGYTKFADDALRERQRAAWPPYSRLALIRASAGRREDAHAFLALAREQAERAAGSGVRLLGPVSAPMERRAGRFRAQLLLQSVERSLLHRVLAAVRPVLEERMDSRRVRWSIDVDPIELF